MTDEATPLLQRDDERGTHDEPKETPIPWGQFSLTLVLQLAEPMSSQVIYPFLPALIRELGVTEGDETKVGYYVGLMQSIFFATQAVTVLHWSRISDRIGRKPVILVGLIGLSISMYCFGLAKTFPALVIARSLNGALNGNIGVIKSMMGELTDSTNVARAYSYQPVAWSSGSTLGPLIGGALSHPTERFPNVFGGNVFLEKYPYFLPCAIPATFSIIAWITTYLFLNETNPTGFTFRSLLPRRASPSSLKIDTGSTEPIPSTPALRSLLTWPVVLSTTAYALLSLIDIGNIQYLIALWETLNEPCTNTYTAYRALQPVFYSNPRSLGGLGLPPHAIGIALAFLGAFNGIWQISCFARITKRFGNKAVYLTGIASAAPIFILFPVMSAVVRAEDRVLASVPIDEDGPEYRISFSLVGLVVLQLALTLLLNMCYGSVFIFITAAANAIPVKSPSSHPVRTPISSSSSATIVISPSTPGKATPKKLQKAKKGKRTLGAVNGVAQMVVSIMRCVGPYSASALFARGLQWEYGHDTRLPNEPVPDPLSDSLLTASVEDAMIWRRLGGLFVYIVLVVLVGATLVLGSKLPDVPWAAVEDGNEYDNVEEAESVEQ